jgi:hypothetical protein
MNKASRMMIGIGTPNIHKRIERPMMLLLYELA